MLFLTTPLARLRLTPFGIAESLAGTLRLGPLLRVVARRVLPCGTLVWTRIRSGEVVCSSTLFRFISFAVECHR